MKFKKSYFLLFAAILSTTSVFAASLPVKSQSLNATIKSQATLSVQWVPNVIYGTGAAPAGQNMGVLTINSAHLTKVSIVSPEADQRDGVITFFNQNSTPANREWMIAGIRPLTGTTITSIPGGYALTPSNGQTNLVGSIPLQFYAQYISNGGGANGNDITPGAYTATINITTEIG
ncbi:hypothetical protein AA481_005184 [Salmonella enterica subsp. enterica]|nr:hypothetical protein [Salmonella enterica subsp. enterica serovar Abaetetuba]